MKSVKIALAALAAAALLAAGGCSRKPKDLYTESFADLMQEDGVQESESLSGEKALQLLAASCLQTVKNDEPDGWLAQASWNYGLEQAACISQEDRVLVLSRLGDGQTPGAVHARETWTDKEKKQININGIQKKAEWDWTVFGRDPVSEEGPARQSANALLNLLTADTAHVIQACSGCYAGRLSLQEDGYQLQLKLQDAYRLHKEISSLMAKSSSIGNSFIVDVLMSQEGIIESAMLDGEFCTGSLQIRALDAAESTQMLEFFDRHQEITENGGAGQEAED